MTAESKTNPSFLEKPIFANLVINWELVLYGLIFIVAVITRFYALGDRVMSHDESLHALFSFKLYNGEGYIHDPLMHGPLQFHLVALSYLIFGDNDFSARIPAALFGVALTMLPFWFRPWLGRVGALVVSFGLLISPALLYYERYIRNESFITFFTALMALSLFAYMRSRQPRWLYIGAIAVSLSLATKEVAFIHGFIGAVFIASAFMWETLSKKNRRYGAVGLLLITIALLIAALFLQGMVPQDGVGFNGEKTAGVVMMIFGLLVGVLAIYTNTDTRNKPIASVIKYLASVFKVLLGPVVVAVVIFFLLHTTFFTNPAGFVSGTWGAISYWLNQQDVARGGQPGYYYALLMPMYEFLPLLLGGIGGLIYMFKRAPSFVENFDAESGEETYPSDGGTFAAYLIFWAIASFVIYTWAGEKMPWLTTHITLPFIFLMGHVSQAVLNKFDWRVLTRRDGMLFAALSLLLGTVIVALISAEPFQGQSIQDIQATSQFIIAALVGLAVLYGLWYTGTKLGRKSVLRIAYVVIFAVLSLFTIRFAWLSSFVNYDYVNEFLVYAHGAPDVKWMLDEIDDISQRTVGDKQIKVAYGGVIWPLEWYMREYPNRAFFGSNPNRDALDAPVVIISPDSEVMLEDVEPYLGDKYERFRYRQVWWPIEDYKNQTFKQVWNDYFSPDPTTLPEGTDPKQAVKDKRQWLWDILFYRKVNNQTFNEWPYRTQMYFFVRKDVLNDLWDYQTGPLDLVQTGAPVDPYTDIKRTLPAVQVWGSNGSGDGQFMLPRAMTVSPQGQVYVADAGNHRIQVFDQSGNFLKSWGGEAGVNPGQLGDEVWGLAVSEAGEVYVADTWNHRIQVFDEDGNFLRQFGTFADTQSDVNGFPGSFWGPRGIAIDGDGNILVADTGNKRIQKFSPDGTFMGVWGGGGVVPGRFEEPTDVTLDAEGNIYVADAWNQRIQKFDSGFNFVAEWPVVGWDSQNIVNKPYLAVDEQGRIYASDPENYRVIVYNSDGSLNGTFGQFGQDVESFRLPLGLATGDGGALFVLDSDNNRVMKFQY